MTRGGKASITGRIIAEALVFFYFKARYKEIMTFTVDTVDIKFSLRQGKTVGNENLLC